MEPLDYLSILRRRWHVIVAAVAVAAAAAWLVTPGDAQLEVTTYEASHTLYRESGASLHLPTVAFLSTTGELPRRVAEELGWDGPVGALVGQVSIEANEVLGSLVVTTTQENPERAVEVADTYALEIIEFFDEQKAGELQQQLEVAQRQVEATQQRIEELEAQLAQAPEETAEAELLIAEQRQLLERFGEQARVLRELEQALPASGLVSLEAATATPIEPEGIQPPGTRTGRVALASGLGLILGLALALVLERVDTRLRTRQGIERALMLPVITEIPRLPFLRRRQAASVVRDQPASLDAEAYRYLRLAVQLMPRWVPPIAEQQPELMPNGERVALPAARSRLVEGDTRVVLVTSANAGAGKSTTVANLAAAFAEVGKRVLVVDCDFRRPEMHEYLGSSQGAGVTEFLKRGAEGADRERLERLARPTAIEGVALVPSGSPVKNPGELITPGQDLIPAAKELADIVLIDTGPILAVNDTAALIPSVDAVVLVMRSGQTSLDAAQRAREVLGRVEAPVLGVVLTGVAADKLDRNYYSQYHSKAKAKAKAPSKPRLPWERQAG